MDQAHQKSNPLQTFFDNSHTDHTSETVLLRLVSNVLRYHQHWTGRTAHTPRCWCSRRQVGSQHPADQNKNIIWCCRPYFGLPSLSSERAESDSSNWLRQLSMGTCYGRSSAGLSLHDAPVHQDLCS